MDEREAIVVKGKKHTFMRSRNGNLERTKRDFAVEGNKVYLLDQGMV